LIEQSCVQCWDNSTRGLDASNALDLVRVLRQTADQKKKTVIATLYQAGNGIYGLFDKILVLAEGREIYYGPRATAQKYFEDMGFVCSPGANVADFLTSVAVHTERQIAKGFENSVPRTAEDFEIAYKQGETFQQMLQEIESIPKQALAEEAEVLKEVTNQERNRQFSAFSRSNSTYTVSLRRQIMSCTKRSVHPLLSLIPL
jgi:ATP-binding cassette subfamily G (WHITE) protein 2 (SNQ2)